MVFWEILVLFITLIENILTHVKIFKDIYIFKFYLVLLVFTFIVVKGGILVLIYCVGSLTISEFPNSLVYFLNNFSHPFRISLLRIQSARNSFLIVIEHNNDLFRREDKNQNE